MPDMPPWAPGGSIGMSRDPTVYERATIVEIELQEDVTGEREFFGSSEHPMPAGIYRVPFNLHPPLQTGPTGGSPIDDCYSDGQFTNDGNFKPTIAKRVTFGILYDVGEESYYWTFSPVSQISFQMTFDLTYAGTMRCYLSNPPGQVYYRAPWGDQNLHEWVEMEIDPHALNETDATLPMRARILDDTFRVSFDFEHPESDYVPGETSTTESPASSAQFEYFDGNSSPPDEILSPYFSDDFDDRP